MYKTLWSVENQERLKNFFWSWNFIVHLFVLPFHLWYMCQIMPSVCPILLGRIWEECRWMRILCPFVKNPPDSTPCLSSNRSRNGGTESEAGIGGQSSANLFER